MLGLRAVSRAFQVVPRPLYRWLGRLLSLLSRRYHREDYRETKAVLAEFFPAAPPERVASWADHIFFLRALKQLDFLLFPSLTERTARRFVCYAPHEFVPFREPRGRLFVGYHLGNHNWFAVVFGLEGLGLHTLRERGRKWFNWLASPGQVFRPGRDTRALVKRLLRGEMAGMMGDVFEASGARVEVEFLGRRVGWPTVAARLARLGRAEVWVFFSPRLPDGRVHLFARRLSLPDHDDPRYEEEFVRAYLAELERFVSTNPEQWLRWRYLKSLLLPES